MPPTCGDWLSVLRSSLREPLFHAGGTERLHRLARRLPGNLLAALETRLASPASDARPIDLSVRIRDRTEALQLTERVSPRIRSFLSLWADGSLPQVHSVWLEFDLDREPGDVLEPVPSAKLFPGVDSGWLADSLFPALHEKPVSERQRRLVQLCHEAVPAPAYLLYVFSLSSRGTDALRLEIFGLTPAGIFAYLERVAPEAVSAVEGTAPLFEDVERIHLSLDLGEEILPRIGIEGSFSRLPRREPRWRELFDRLVDRGLCRPEERDAALAWPGAESFWTAPDDWPAGAPGGFCVRKLSHVKVICRPDQKMEAKVYLLFGPHQA